MMKAAKHRSGSIRIKKLRSTICNALENLTSAESPGKKTDGQQGISLTLHLDNEDFPEITITLFRHGGIQYPETVNGKIVAYISRSEAVELMEVVRTLVL